MVEIHDFIPARRFLAPLTTSLWRWDETAGAIVWNEGGTIAFRGELVPVLRRLAPRGLPSMNALAWLLGACRQNWPEAAKSLVSQAGALASADRCELPDWLPKLMVQLDAMHGLRAELRTLPAAKAELAAMVFEPWRWEVGAEDAQRVVRMLAEYREPDLVAPRAGSQNRLGDVLAGLQLLHEGLKEFDAEAFRLRFQTGLEQAIEPADVDLEPAERTRQLIARLQDDEELGGLARVARHLLAAIHLPRTISDREDLPVGGVSDISNRGPLDRLLSSELAHDDLTLAVRVAMNEALYLRRETPPSNPPKHRAVLLDSGVRLWGIPRVFATAVGMALAAGGQRSVRVDLFRAAGDRVVPVSLADRAGVVAHLETLEPDAHPGRSLAAFGATASTEAGLLDAVVVTGEDVTADHDFQRSLAALQLPSLLLATVSREGRFRLVSQGLRGKKLLGEARLELDKLLSRPPRPKAPLVDPRMPDELPAILSVRPLPLFLSDNRVDPMRTWKTPWGGALSISGDRCLLHWEAKNRGGRLLGDQVPPGIVHWSGSSADGMVSLAVVGMLERSRLSLLRVPPAADACEVIPLDLDAGQPQAVSGHAGMVFVIYRTRIDAFETTDGRKAASIEIPVGLFWNRDRFFTEGSQWYALSYDGSLPVFEPLLSKGRAAVLQFAAFVDVPGVEGPVGVKWGGGLYRPAEDRDIPLRADLLKFRGIHGVSRFGHAVLHLGILGNSAWEVSLADGAARETSANLRDWFRYHLWSETPIRPQQVRSRFYAIFVDKQGRLGLVGRRRREALIDRSARGELILESRRLMDSDKRCVREFQPAAVPTGAGYELKVARWSDGSLAWIDSRGMLHLKSSDRSLPEVTLVLRDGALAGWTSEGRTFGMAYFAGETSPGAETGVCQNILKRFVALLR